MVLETCFDVSIMNAKVYLSIADQTTKRFLQRWEHLSVAMTRRSSDSDDERLYGKLILVDR